MLLQRLEEFYLEDILYEIALVISAKNNLKLWFMIYELPIEIDLCDVTLAYEDNQIKAYKIIISSYGPY